MDAGNKPWKISRRQALVGAGAALAGVVVAGVIPLAGCTSSPSQDITATMDDHNSLIFHIRGSVETPGEVTVRYWGQGDGPFTTAPVSTNGATTFSVPVMRLRPSTQYQFQVFLSAASNATLQYQGAFKTGPLPPALQTARIQVIQGTPTYELLLLDYNCTDFSGVAIIDASGQIIWYYENVNQVFCVTQEANHSVVFNELGMNVGYKMWEIAPDNGVIHTVSNTLQNGTVCKPHGEWSHEMLVRPNQKIWTIGAEIRAITINGASTMQTGGTIDEWDMTKGTVTRLVSMFDLLNPVTDRRVDSNTKGGFFWMGCQNQYSNLTEDWTHTNSLDVLPNGDILVSNRHLDQIMAVKPDFSGIDWKLGGIGSNFTFPNPDDQFYHQHYVRMLPSGNLVIFDNGDTRPAAQGGQYSRALELNLNFRTMQATKVWEYRNVPDIYSSAVGSVVRLPDGNTVVDFGVDPVKENPSVFRVVEADRNGNPVAVTTISSPGKGNQYRAIPITSINGESA